MNTKKTVIAASIAALLAAPAATFAKDQWEYHEDQWGNVVSYGSVQLAQDSSDTWGPWAEFIMPAAGGPVVNPVQFVGEGSGERYRPEPKISAPVVGCEAGTACGYAVFRDHTGEYWDGGEHPATFTARIPPTLDDSATTAWRVTSLDGTTPNYPESGELGKDYYSDSGFRFDRNDYVDGGEGGGGAWIVGSMPETDIPVANGEFGRYLWSYMNGDNCDGECGYGYSSYSSNGTYGRFVAGIVTSAADMSALRANNISAVYNGYAFQGAPVTINVNFGTASWSGSWNNGAGRDGFHASGGITGSNIQSTSVSATDGPAYGSVNGSFYGSQAAALGGVVDVTKDSGRYVDLYLTTKQ